MTNEQFASKMICPACRNPTRRTRNGQCVHCRVDLELFTYTFDGKSRKEFRLREPEKAVEIKAAVAAGETLTDVEGRMLTPEGSNPEIIMLSVKPRKYRVTYRQIMPSEWTYCPDCHGRMFQTMMLHSQLEFVCPHCFATTEFNFRIGLSSLRW